MTGSRDIVYRIAHFADFHLRKADADFERAIALIAHALGLKVNTDHVVVAGDVVDLANIGLVEKFVEELKKLGLTNPSKLTIVPGNHDIFPASKRAPWVRMRRPTTLWSNFCRAVTFSRRGRGCRQLLPKEPFPVGKVLSDDVVLAALDSTRNARSDPRQWSAGELVEEHVNAVSDFFDLHTSKTHRVIVMHHNPWASESENEAFPMVMVEPDAQTAIGWLGACGASLLLCGHYHTFGGVEEFESDSFLGLCAGTAGGADEDDGMRAYHVVDLMKNGKVKITQHSFELEEVDELVEAMSR